MIYIYILCDFNGHIKYVGQSKNPFVRYKKHLADKTNTHKSNWIQSLLIKNQKPELVIIDWFDNKKDSDYFEEWYYYYFTSLGMNLTNHPDFLGCGISPGTVFTNEHKNNLSKSHKGKKLSTDTILKIKKERRGKKLSDEHKNKIRKANIGKKHSEATILKLRYAGKNNRNFFGKKHTEATKKLMSLKKKGKKLSESHKFKIGIASKKRLSNKINHPQFGKKQSSETINKRVEKNKGLKRSEAFRSKMSMLKKGKKLSETHRKKLSEKRQKKVLQFNLDGIFLKEYKSILSASVENNIWASQIGLCCRKKAKHAGGFLWEFKK